MAQVLSEEEKQKMRAFLEVMGDRVEILECIDTYAYFFPDWLVKITEGLQNLIADRQANNIPCDEEKEVLTNAGYFFTKMAYFSGLISEWHKDWPTVREQPKKRWTDCNGTIFPAVRNFKTVF
ncbi:MAG: hypothetical protein LBG96_17660 [Tannerella sp.]|jgi:hypothetical protein|nr:hypothetical protein [Tannerella sp.]